MFNCLLSKCRKVCSVNISNKTRVKRNIFLNRHMFVKGTQSHFPNFHLTELKSREQESGEAPVNRPDI